MVLGAPAGSATAAHPLMLDPLSVKATVPVGATPLTAAVKVTLMPNMDGSCELESVVVEVAGNIVNVKA